MKKATKEENFDKNSVENGIEPLEAMKVVFFSSSPIWSLPLCVYVEKEGFIHGVPSFGSHLQGDCSV